MRTGTIKLLILTLVINGAKAQTVDFNFSTASGFFCSPQTVTFTQNCSPAPISLIWNFGNGQAGSASTENIVYAVPGTYTVKLTAVYQNDAITTSKTIVINPSPTVSLTADRNYLCQPGSVVFTATGSASVTNYEWNFGDGSPIITTGGNSINHAYGSYIQYTALVKGITANGCAATATYNVNVMKFPISGTVTPPNGCIPSNSTLSVNTTLPAGDATQNFTWNFGDGSPVTSGASNSISHVYNITTPITTASVSITTVQGCTNQLTFSPFAFGTPPFGTVAKTVAARDTFCGSETILFYGKATNATLYNWDFGDGTTASVADTLTTHKYRTLGDKLVIVTPYFNGCAGTKDTINIFIEGVIADYLINNTCASKNRYTFTNRSLGNVDHFEWIFSDTPSLIDSVNYSPTHTFPPAGVFNSFLLLIDSITGCRDSLTTDIFTATPALSRISNPVCKDSLITYRVSGSYPPGKGFAYEFHVNGNVVNNGEDSVLKYNPAVFGNFTEYVVIRDGRGGTCDDSLFLSGQTRVQGPVVDFDIARRKCVDSSLIITNNSYPFFPSDQIIKWDWDFGDSNTDSVKNPAPHLYAVAYNYIVTLTATDINGCKQKMEKPVFVSPLPIISVFPAIDTICQKDTVQLRAYTVDSLIWMTTVNINCNNCDTIKAWPTTTTQYIAMAINNVGCKNYDTSLVKVYEPINLAVFPADTTICAGKTIQYNLNATGITLWSPPTFLNNHKIKNPVARPDTSITYTIIVKDSVGCYADTALANVEIFPNPTVNAGPDLVLGYNTTYNIAPLYSADVASYLWSPPGNLSCTNCPSPNGVALQKETYGIEATNNYGCKSRDTINIFVNCLETNLLMPTAFTPNSDGKNDYFYPITRGYKVIRSFIIYNRYGNKVFERKDFAPNIATLGWNGATKDYKYATTEVFAWYMEAECDLGQINSTKGTVILLR